MTCGAKFKSYSLSRYQIPFPQSFMLLSQIEASFLPKEIQDHHTMSAPVIDNLWDAAIAQQQQKRLNGGSSGSGTNEGLGGSSSNPAVNRESTLVVVGSKDVGKSTLIYRLLERQEAAKPTLALEYTYGRKNNQGIQKVVGVVIP